MASNEGQIIRRILGGDVNAYETLVIENQKNVYNLALKMVGNEQDALDITQDAFVKAYTNLSAFNGTGRFSVWMYRLTYNLCIDFLRKKNREKTVPIENEDDEGNVIQLEIADGRPKPEEEVEEKTLQREIIDAVDELPDKYRTVLSMRCIDDMSYADIAATLHISEGTVKSRIFRGREILAEILTKRGTFDDGIRHNNGKAVKRRGKL